MRLVQYRDKKNRPQEVLRAAGEIAEVFAGVDATLILNDRADLAALLGGECMWGRGICRLEMRGRCGGSLIGGNAEVTQSCGGCSTHNEEQVLHCAAG